MSEIIDDPEYPTYVISRRFGQLGSYQGHGADRMIAELKLSGHEILKVVTGAEWANRLEFRSTNSIHAAKRLRTLRHWQR